MDCKRSMNLAKDDFAELSLDFPQRPLQHFVRAPLTSSTVHALNPTA
jgi:hypothetical protein